MAFSAYVFEDTINIPSSTYDMKCVWLILRWNFFSIGAKHSEDRMGDRAEPYSRPMPESLEGDRSPPHKYLVECPTRCRCFSCPVPYQGEVSEQMTPTSVMAVKP